MQKGIYSSIISVYLNLNELILNYFIQLQNVSFQILNTHNFSSLLFVTKEICGKINFISFGTKRLILNICVYIKRKIFLSGYISDQLSHKLVGLLDCIILSFCLPSSPRKLIENYGSFFPNYIFWLKVNIVLYLHQKRFYTFRNNHHLRSLKYKLNL